MAVLELYGKCKELGYCDCGGFLGCVSPALVECTVCDRSHAPSHPHIANIDGDTPIDDEPETQPTVERELPAWLKDKPAAHVLRPATGTRAEELCQVCGKTWAPKHACKDAESPGTSEFNPPIRPANSGSPALRQPTCEVCGLVKRSNHNCKGAATTEKPCPYCKRAGQPCVRHGGERSSVRTSRRHQERQEASAESGTSQKVGFYGRRIDEQVATELPNPVSIADPSPVHMNELDRELAAIASVLAALDGLTPDEVKRALEYVADRKGINKETQS